MTLRSLASTGPLGAVYEFPAGGILEGTQRLPDFEGEPVQETRLKLTSGGALEADIVARIDDLVRVYVEGRVTRVEHVVDARSGRLRRVHTVQILDAVALPPDDDERCERASH